MDDSKTKFPVWKESYAKLGVSPRELYMRQQKLCYLKPVMLPDGKIKIFCTDGDQSAETCKMLNPTQECAECMATFAIKTMEGKIG